MYICKRVKIFLFQQTLIIINYLETRCLTFLRTDVRVSLNESPVARVTSELPLLDER